MSMFRVRHPLALSLTAMLSLLVLPGCKRGQSNNVDGPKPVAAKPVVPPALAALPADGVKAVYLTGWAAGNTKHLQKICELADRTEINAVVIDVKDDGWVSYDADVPLAKEIQAKYGAKKTGRMISDIDKVLAKLKEHKLFSIARIACFRDTPLAKLDPSTAVKDRSGAVWLDRSKHGWLNSYSKKARDYNMALAADAAKHGFNEVQFDYVRFPSEGKLSDLVYEGRPKDGKREDQIASFLAEAQAQCKTLGVWFSADVFGLTSQVKNDEGIGQKFEKITAHLDYLCPMVYPSHYAPRTYGLANPNAEPYKLIKATMHDAQLRIKSSPNCKLRPWLQAFSLGGIKYGPNELGAQIKACKELGIHEYLLWNASCSYRLFEPILKKS